MTARLARLDTAVDDGERVEQLRALEVLKAAAAAAQARVSAAFVVSQCAGQRAAGMPGERVGRGIAAQGTGPAGVPGAGGPLHRLGAGARRRAAGHLGRAHPRRHLRVAGDDRGPGDRLAEPGAPGRGGRGVGRPARRSRGPGGGGRGQDAGLPARPAGPTWPGSRPSSPTGGSACVPPPTRWPGCPRCCPPGKASPPTRRWRAAPSRPAPPVMPGAGGS